MGILETIAERLAQIEADIASLKEAIKEPVVEGGLTVAEAAELTTLGKSTINAMVASGEIESAVIRDRRVIPKEAIRQLLKTTQQKQRENESQNKRTSGKNT